MDTRIPVFPAAPLLTAQGKVAAEWTDYNHHMNVAYYVLAFDRGTDQFLGKLGMDLEDPQFTQRSSVFALEMHVTYEREMRQDDPWSVFTQLVDADHKRIHLMHEMRHTAEGWRAATNEVIVMHMDMASRRSAPFPDHIQTHIDALKQAHATLPQPDTLGRVIGLPGRKETH